LDFSPFSFLSLLSLFFLCVRTHIYIYFSFLHIFIFFSEASRPLFDMKTNLNFK
jgi:hypothetical protein